MDQFRWIDHTQPGRLVQGTTMLYISAAFDLFNSFLIGGSLALVFLVLALLKAGGAYGIANEKKIGYLAGCTGAVLAVLLDLYFLTESPVFGLIGVAIGVWIASLLLHDSSRSYARIWFK
jgi:hypothetical protein